ncbi:MAG: hypothetical protein EP329_05510, partial [Deltaproteobacteria bacterium]
MEALLALAVAAALIAVAVRLQRRSDDRWSRRLQALAAAHDGLEHHRAGGEVRAAGVVDGVAIAVDATLALPGKPASVTTRVRVDTALPPSLTLGREGLGASLA